MPALLAQRHVYNEPDVLGRDEINGKRGSTSLLRFA